MNPIDFPRSNFTRKTILENPFPFELKTKTKNSKNRFYDLIRFLLKHHSIFKPRYLLLEETFLFIISKKYVYLDLYFYFLFNNTNRLRVKTSEMTQVHIKCHLPKHKTLL
ncbi:hypothetical protein LEP1GSC127_2895 [Leptospira kirschneri str. 200801925]|nr:hypothetical protein LEP1GSC044_2909 [Leptospira kirschneri serovar Grippotyphosa str. RM52]EKQ82569.1 hypothetical protein LEP1GSC064_1962 [Leptospira kirschneri serovar Grippotyphosa str. Moskva]EKR07553.1 hypothetical protein LEP1GSC122_2595 [Leptospira kirschneri serovar Valbuzzi str. 200702274]EMK00777.1 hypothetical protein LEP1GSC176_3750 [Leptospira kirschneri str. MMD1493]EMK13740.1 hypothetical protein LEP1GSC042_3088 [Leptospira kirschneri serovar Bim str. PUO 1247]EMN03346.1 hyp